MTEPTSLRVIAFAVAYGIAVLFLNGWTTSSIQAQCPNYVQSSLVPPIWTIFGVDPYQRNQRASGSSFQANPNYNDFYLTKAYPTGNKQSGRQLDSTPIASSNVAASQGDLFSCPQIVSTHKFVPITSIAADFFSNQKFGDPPVEWIATPTNGQLAPAPDGETVDGFDQADVEFDSQHSTNGESDERTPNPTSSPSDIRLEAPAAGEPTPADRSAVDQLSKRELVVELRGRLAEALQRARAAEERNYATEKNARAEKSSAEKRIANLQAKIATLQARLQTDGNQNE